MKNGGWGGGISPPRYGNTQTGHRQVNNQLTAGSRRHRTVYYMFNVTGQRVIINRFPGVPGRRGHHPAASSAEKHTRVQAGEEKKKQKKKPALRGTTKKQVAL